MNGGFAAGAAARHQALLRLSLVPGLLVLGSGVLAAVLTVTSNHADAAAHARSASFVDHTKAVCTNAAGELAQLPEPPNVHRAVARLLLHLHRAAALLRAGAVNAAAYRHERRDVLLSARLLNVKACMAVVP